MCRECGLESRVSPIVWIGSVLKNRYLGERIDSVGWVSRTEDEGDKRGYSVRFMKSIGVGTRIHST